MNHQSSPDPAATPPPADLRNVRPRTPAELKVWIRDYLGISIPDVPVCPDHQSPWDCFEAMHLKRPPVALILGSRGSGKSFLSALDTHLTSRWDPDHDTRILGGSKAQSGQIYRALRTIATTSDGDLGDDAETIAKLRKEGATYTNGASVEILAASPTSVRGPHVPSLKLDEVDEIDVDIRESAMGMCLGRKKNAKKQREAVPASIIMTSTCHRPAGPMAQLIEQAGSGDFPLYTMCVFEVLETCPEERSGPNLENCDRCPLKDYCHNVFEGQTPKAKRSNGHYPIDSLIQKLKVVGKKTFEADYLCRQSSGEAAWFPEFDVATHVSDLADHNPGHHVHLAVDTGVFTGAVLFQVIPAQEPDGSCADVIHVVADYLAEGRSAEANAWAIQSLAQDRCRGRLHFRTTDPAGSHRTGIGPTVMSEYRRAGLELTPWPLRSVVDSLALLESFIAPSTGAVRFRVHPRCKRLIEALQGYRRAKRGGQWTDKPEDPQHPHEDLIDALRGGLCAHYPEGRVRPPHRHRVLANRIF